jgi:hypothetical protein
VRPPRGELWVWRGCLSVFGEASVSVDNGPSRAVSMSSSIGTPRVFGVQPDRFDHQVEPTGAVELARYTVRLIRRLTIGETV